MDKENQSKENLINWTINELEKYQDEKRVKLASGYYPTSMKVIGVNSPNIKIVLKELREKLKELNLPAKDIIVLAKALVNTNTFECQQMAYSLLDKEKKSQVALTKQDIRDLGKTLDNWASVDSYSVLIYGYAWRTGIITIEDVKQLQQYPHLHIC